MSEVDWQVDRCKLYDLHQQNPETSPQELAKWVGRSEKWVRKWLVLFEQRIREGETTHLFASQSRAMQVPSLIPSMSKLSAKAAVSMG